MEKNDRNSNTTSTLTCRSDSLSEEESTWLPKKLNSIERRSISALAAVYGLRMFGLFLILPVLALYAEDLDGATPMLMGIALGVYGISQAVFQIPFGILSDRFGRKPIIIMGVKHLRRW